MSWLAPYLAAGYRRGAQGPQHFDCWGLVRELQHARWGRTMPALQVGPAVLPQPGNAQWQALARLCRHSGWVRRPPGQPPALGDVLLMRGGGGLHVGVALDGLRMVHAHGGPRPGFEAQPQHDVGAVSVARLDALGLLGLVLLSVWAHRAPEDETA